MSIPKYFEIHKPFLQFLNDGSTHTKKEAKAYLANYFDLSDSELSEFLPSGRQKVFDNRVSWASTYLKKAGLIVSPARATFMITGEGKKVLDENPEVIDPDYLMKFDQFRLFWTKGEPISERSTLPESQDATPDAVFEDAFKQINRELKDDLLSEIQRLSPTAFEQMVMDLMSKMGYGTFENAARTTAASGDEGIDGIIMQDKLGFDLIYIQVKKWSEDHTVGRPEVQAFGGAIAGKDGSGLFVTTSSFSRQAKEYAADRHIILMDGDKLTDYMIEYNFGVSLKKLFEIKELDTDLFDGYTE